MPQDKGFSKIEDILESGESRTNHLLAIAINDYVHCPKLNNAVKDVQDFVALMQEKYAFQKEYTYTLYNEEATQDAILQKLEELANKLTEADNLVVYFSGHGEYKEVFEEGYWIPVEAEKNRVGQYISNSNIKRILGAIDTHHTFLIADSCFSGSLFARGAKAISSRLEQDPSRWGLTSGKNEIVSDGKVGENSPFATSLLYQLSEGHKPITVQELCYRVLEQTAANAEQTPLGEPLLIEGHKNGQFVFRLQKDEGRDWVDAKYDNSIADYTAFIINYPDSQHIETAKKAIETLKETKIWKEAVDNNTIQSYFSYTDLYPKGQYLQQAFQNISILEDLKDWTAARNSDTITAYLGYKRKHPKGKYTTQANENIKRIRQQATVKPTLPVEVPKVETTPPISKKQEIVERNQSKQTRKSKKKRPFDWNRIPWFTIEFVSGIVVFVLALWQLVPSCETIEEPYFKYGQNDESNLVGLWQGDDWIVSPKYYGEPKAMGFTEDLAVVNFKNRFGFIDKKGKIVIKYQFLSAAPFYHGRAMVMNNNGQKKYGFIDKTGKMIIPNIYDEAANFSIVNKEIAAFVKKDGKSFYIKKDGKKCTECPQETRNTTIKPKKDEIKIIEVGALRDLEELMVKIDGGIFKMGDERYDKEQPVRRVTIKSFKLLKFEITQERWESIMGKNPSIRPNCPICPVENVSWKEVQEFIEKLNLHTGKSYRLPTEAEWEYAATGGNKTKGYLYAGSSSLDRVAWYRGNSGNLTHIIGKKRPNELGLYDMSGNVYEWCQDTWQDNYLNAPTDGRAWIKNTSKNRVYRGGSYFGSATYCRVTFRYFNSENYRNSMVGFRLASDL